MIPYERWPGEVRPESAAIRNRNAKRWAVLRGSGMLLKVVADLDKIGMTTIKRTAVTACPAFIDPTPAVTASAPEVPEVRPYKLPAGLVGDPSRATRDRPAWTFPGETLLLAAHAARDQIRAGTAPEYRCPDA